MADSLFYTISQDLFHATTNLERMIRTPNDLAFVTKFLSDKDVALSREYLPESEYMVIRFHHIQKGQFPSNVDDTAGQGGTMSQKNAPFTAAGDHPKLKISKTMSQETDLHLFLVPGTYELGSYVRDTDQDIEKAIESIHITPISGKGLLPAYLNNTANSYHESRYFVTEALIRWGGFNHQPAVTKGLTQSCDFRDEQGNLRSTVVERKLLMDGHGQQITMPYIANDSYEGLLDSMFRPRTDITVPQLQGILRKIYGQLDNTILKISWYSLQIAHDDRVDNKAEYMSFLEMCMALRARMDWYFTLV